MFNNLPKPDFYIQTVNYILSNLKQELLSMSKSPSILVSVFRQNFSSECRSTISLCIKMRVLKTVYLSFLCTYSFESESHCHPLPKVEYRTLQSLLSVFNGLFSLL